MTTTKKPAPGTPAAPMAPEVRQCLVADSHLFGAVAVKADGGRWGYIHPAQGGGWVQDADVDDWTVRT